MNSKNSTNSLTLLIGLALTEDIGKGDITVNTLIPPNQKAQANIITKQKGIIAGLPLISMVYKYLNKSIKVTLKVKDGARVKEGQVIATVTGLARPILTGERTMVNFLGRLSGVATLTNQYVQRVKKYGVTILDTRKTIPGWRELDKYAVRMGGGTNHRMGLYDVILTKSNHLAIIGGIDNFNLRNPPDGESGLRIPIEIEVRNIKEFHTALSKKPNIIMLDNMKPPEIKKAVQLRNKLNPKVKLEVSGGINLKNIQRFASTRVDYISSGALTHSAPALDIAMHVV